MSTFAVAPVRSSSFIEDIDYNLNDTQVRVAFKDDSIHFYDVTLDAIQELLNPMTSFGFWFNKYCRWVILPLRLSIHPLFISTMFNISRRSSSFVQSIGANPLTGRVEVFYKNGSIYEYDNVSRRAILNLMVTKNMSLGFWVNENLLPYYKNVGCVAA